MDTTFCLILTSITVAVVSKWTVKLLNFFWFRPRKLEKTLRDQGLNGTPYRPLLGDLKEYIRVEKTEKPKPIKLSDDSTPRIFGYHHQILTKYGKNSFWWLGPWPRLNITDPELIKEILSKPDQIQQPFPEIGKILAGGLVYLQGEKWAKHRKIVNPAFHMDKLKNMVPAIGVSCSNTINELTQMINTSNNNGWSEIDIWPYLENLIGDIISRTAFSSNNEEATRIFQLQREKTKLTMEIFQLSMIPGWRYLPTRVNRKLKAMTNELQSLLRGMIEKRQKDMDRGEAIPNDLLGIMMESNSRFNQENGNKKNGGMSIDDVIDECNLFYFAGSRSTACLLVWTMVMLCIHPQWQTKAREEVNRVLGNSHPSFESLSQLKTVTMILQEVLRLYSPIPLIVRGTTETVKLGNMTLPPGVLMTLLIGLLHRDPDIWGDDANEFKPQRFSEGFSKAAKIQSSFTPFSSGLRTCIAQNFVLIEAKVAMAMILQNFSFELSPSYLHAPFYDDVNLLPEYGAPIILRSL